MVRRALKRKHLLVIPLVLLTFIIFSSRRKEPTYLHGYIVLENVKGDGLPGGVIQLRTVNQDSQDTLALGSGHLYLSASLLLEVSRRSGIDAELALLNPSDTQACVHVTFLPEGAENPVHHESLVLPPHHKLARSASEWLSTTGGHTFRGMFRVESDRPLALAAVQLAGGQLRPTWLSPIRPSDEVTSDRGLIFPHWASGGGYRSSLRLWNPSRSPMEFDIVSRDPDGNPSWTIPVLQPSASRHVRLAPGSSILLPLDTSRL